MTALNPVMRVGEQIAEALTVHGLATRASERARSNCSTPCDHRSGAPRRDYPHQLSGGMRQRVMIAIALACRPPLVIADEPTTALDVTIQAQILDLLREMKRAFNLSLLLITHDFGVIAEMADRVAVMYAGEIVEQGPVRQILRKPQHPYTPAARARFPAARRPALAVPAEIGDAAAARSPPSRQTLRERKAACSGPSRSSRGGRRQLLGRRRRDVRARRRVGQRQEHDRALHPAADRADVGEVTFRGENVLGFSSTRCGARGATCRSSFRIRIRRSTRGCAARPSSRSRW